MSRPVQEMPRPLLTSVPNWMILCYLPFPSSLLLMFTASNLGTQNEDDPTNTTVSIPFIFQFLCLERNISHVWFTCSYLSGTWMQILRMNTFGRSLATMDNCCM